MELHEGQGMQNKPGIRFVKGKIIHVLFLLLDCKIMCSNTAKVVLIVISTGFWVNIAIFLFELLYIFESKVYISIC